MRRRGRREPPRVSSASSRAASDVVRIEPPVGVLRADAERAGSRASPRRAEIEPGETTSRRGRGRAPFHPRGRTARRRRGVSRSDARRSGSAALPTADPLRGWRPPRRCCRRPVPIAAECAWRSEPSRRADHLGVRWRATPGLPRAKPGSCGRSGHPGSSHSIRNGPRAGQKRQRVVHRERLKDGPQPVIAVGPRIGHAQREIDFRAGVHRDRRSVRLYLPPGGLARGPDCRSSSTLIGWVPGGIWTVKASTPSGRIDLNLRQRESQDRSASRRGS